MKILKSVPPFFDAHTDSTDVYKASFVLVLKLF